MHIVVPRLIIPAQIFVACIGSTNSSEKGKVHRNEVQGRRYQRTSLLSNLSDRVVRFSMSEPKRFVNVQELKAKINPEDLKYGSKLLRKVANY